MSDSRQLYLIKIFKYEKNGIKRSLEMLFRQHSTKLNEIAPQPYHDCPPEYTKVNGELNQISNNKTNRIKHFS